MEAAEQFINGQQISQRLTGVEFIAAAIYEGNCRILRHCFDIPVLLQPSDNEIRAPSNIPYLVTDICDGEIAVLPVLGKGISAEILDSRAEGKRCACGGFLKQHVNLFAAQEIDIIFCADFILRRFQSDIPALPLNIVQSGSYVSWSRLPLQFFLSPFSCQRGDITPACWIHSVIHHSFWSA